MASMRALGEDEKRPPHMVLAFGDLALSDTRLHPVVKWYGRLCHRSPPLAKKDVSAS
jgi:hypothetical protein